MSANIKLDDLSLTFDNERSSTNAFGPHSEIPEHITSKFDGKIYKPYSKRDKLGKLCEFTLIPTGTGTMAPSAANLAQRDRKNQMENINADQKEEDFEVVKSKDRTKNTQKY